MVVLFLFPPFFYLLLVSPLAREGFDSDMIVKVKVTEDCPERTLREIVDKRLIPQSGLVT